MRSIPLMMTWEYVASRWHFSLLCVLGANLVPVMLFLLLRSKGVEADDESLQQMLYRFQFLNVLLGIVTTVPLDGFRTRFFAYPCTTTTLTAYEMIPAMIQGGLMTMLLIAFHNAIFGQQFPIWGPALFAMTGTAIYRATYWYAKDIAWFNRGLLEGTVMVFPMATLCGCYLYRFGFFRRMVLIPDDSGLVDTFTHFAVSFAACFVARSGIARNRCGEVSYSSVPIAFLSSMRSEQGFSEFRTSKEAQSWYLRQGNGLALPTMTVFLLLIGLFGVIGLMQRSLNSMVESLIVFSLVSAFAGGILGATSIIEGYVSSRKSQSQNDPLAFGSFFATRPITDLFLAKSLLRASLRITAIAWAIWAIAYLATVGLLYWSGSDAFHVLLEKLRWWVLPGVMLAYWIFAGIGASLILVGRREVLIGLFAACFAILLASLFLTEWLLSPQAKVRFFEAFQTVFGVGLISGTVWLFGQALRRNMIDVTTARNCLAAWLLLLGIIFIEWKIRSGELATRYLLAAGIASLVVVPFASAPLAVGLNRHR